MKIVIEIQDDNLTDAELRELLRHVQRGITEEDWLVEIDTPVYYLRVARIAGVVVAEDCPGDQIIMAVEPLEGS